jgi:integrase
MYQDLKLGGYAKKTQQIYLSAATELVRYYRRSPEKLTREEVRAYVQDLIRTRRPSPQRIRQHLAALKFLYAKTLGLPEVVSFMIWPTDPDRVPTVLSRSEVEVLLRAIENPGYRMLATTIYATGLRIGEVCPLETRDIDAKRGVIHVRHGKCERQRVVPLSPKLLGQLRAYWRLKKPKPPYLFPSRFAEGPARPNSVRCALRAVECIMECGNFRRTRSYGVFAEYERWVSRRGPGL